MPAIDTFQTHARKPVGGPRNLAEVSPSDVSDLANITQWLHVSTGGSLRVTTAEGQDVTFQNILSGWHVLEIQKIHATGTTASGLVVGW